MAVPLLEARFTRRGIPMLEIGGGCAVPARFSEPAREHLATRRTAGLFDFSFMACFEFSGPDAASALARVQTRNPAPLRAGRIAYTLLCREDGSVLNDATIWRHGPERYWLFTGRRSDLSHVEQAAAPWRASISDHSGRFAAIALQGPRSAAILARGLAGEATPALRYYDFCPVRFRGAGCWLGRIGFTGEFGFELVVEADAAPELWDALLKAGEPFDLAECGFEAADSLRIEAGSILFSRELALAMTPHELGLSRLLADAGDYLGAGALRAGRWKSPPRRLVGLVPDARAEGAVLGSLATRAIRADEGERVTPGVACLTSATYSPLLRRVLALGFVAEEDRHPGTRVEVSPGIGAEVARLPFYDPGKILPRGRWESPPAG